VSVSVNIMQRGVYPCFIFARPGRLIPKWTGWPEQNLHDYNVITLPIVIVFVLPFVLQLADNKEVFAGINKKEGIAYPVLVPNITGYQAAVSIH